MLPLIKIASVATAASGKTYVNDLAGRVFFPKNEDLQIEKDHYAYFVETEQTMTKDAEGNLIPLIGGPRKILQITATWATKALAIADLTEMNLLGAEVAAETTKQAKVLGLNDAQVAQLAAAW